MIPVWYCSPFFLFDFSSGVPHRFLLNISCLNIELMVFLYNDFVYTFVKCVVSIVIFFFPECGTSKQLTTQERYFSISCQKETRKYDNRGKRYIVLPWNCKCVKWHSLTWGASYSLNWIVTNVLDEGFPVLPILIHITWCSCGIH